MDDLLKACLVVGSALHALWSGQPDGALLARLDQAGAAVRDLPDQQFTDALRAVLREIDRCRRASEHSSPRLATAVQIAVEAIRR